MTKGGVFPALLHFGMFASAFRQSRLRSSSPLSPFTRREIAVIWCRSMGLI
jgi:hypothetical protein